MMHIEIGGNQKRPLYRQIADGLIERMQSGALPVGARLPATRELASELGTNRNTVVRAYEELAQEGWVDSGVGRGTFVRKRADPVAPQAARSVHRLPWDALLSRAAKAEPLSRADRLARQTSGRDSIRLVGMQPGPEMIPTDLLKKVVDHVLRTKGARALAYSAREGLLELREQIAGDLARRGVPATPDEILITTGSQQALDLAARSLVDPGDKFVVEGQTYAGALNLLSAAGAQLVSVPCDDDGPDVAALSQLAASGAKGMYTIPNCQNPTGRTISLERRLQLVQWCAAAGMPLIEDDYGADLNLDGLPVPTSLRSLDGQVLHLGTYSKKLIPALRIGYLVAPVELLRRIGSLKHAMDLGSSSFLQHVLAEFLDRGYLQVHLERTIPVYRERRDALVAGLQQYVPAEVRWMTPTRGLIVWLDLPMGVSADLVFREAERQGVLVTPGSLTAAGASTRSGLRLTFCSEPPDRLIEGAKRLGRVLHWALEQNRSSPSGAAFDAI